MPQEEDNDLMLGLLATVALGCSIHLPSPTLCFKDNVVIYAGHFEPEITRILDVVRATAPMMRHGQVWVTSANDSTKHVDTSLHYWNRAFDFRIRNIIGHRAVEARLWAERIQEELGRHYDVILALDHINVEFQPKGEK